MASGGLSAPLPGLFELSSAVFRDSDVCDALYPVATPERTAAEEAALHQAEDFSDNPVSLQPGLLRKLGACDSFAGSFPAFALDYGSKNYVSDWECLFCPLP